MTACFLGAKWSEWLRALLVLAIGSGIAIAVEARNGKDFGYLIAGLAVLGLVIVTSRQSQSGVPTMARVPTLPHRIASL